MVPSGPIYPAVARQTTLYAPEGVRLGCGTVRQPIAPMPPLSQLSCMPSGIVLRSAAFFPEIAYNMAVN